ncbi:radical S-adenosyl methionine domain-containing protein 1, mitochondrial [Ornithorhynchus anatinus]|uniref:radical S-adenosyl methionine domain-containing protein 1, mitochondrial n=1 Tax=Ornithorhynchus anatinus TaxID=9258 RepID=UPI0010A7C3D1|nr:radical S-adenosyl methionine domain-containing protein 1, mitochondrial [Ornithorhynchus anatinus]
MGRSSGGRKEWGGSPSGQLGAGLARFGVRAPCWARGAQRFAEGVGHATRTEPPAGQASNRADASATLYLHWPFCEKRCSYCNFNKYIPRGVDEAAMRACLVREAQTLLRLSQVKRVTSVFFGGGTPSLASPRTVSAVLEAVSRAAHVPADAEVTLEANPTSAAASRLEAFRASGVNRLSVGIQSLDDAELRLLGRTHTAAEALQTLEEARRLFPGRTSLDLMFGLPEQSVAAWRRQLTHLLQCCDDHLSLYQLSLERGTALFRRAQRGVLPAPAPEECESGREQMRESDGETWRAGQVAAGGAETKEELSPQKEQGALSSHNWAYWQGGQYIGVGPGAHGRFVPQGAGRDRREARIQTLEPDNWMREVLAFGHGTRKRVPLGELELLEEVLVLGLRTDVGVTHQHWRRFDPHLTLWDAFGACEEVKQMQAQGLLILDGRGLRCSWEGLAVLDSLLLPLLNQLQRSWGQGPDHPSVGLRSEA